MKTKSSVLIVDDDPQLIRLVRLNLESEGYRVMVAGDASGAFEHLHRSTPELIILDIMLPGVNGFELCQRIREFSATPIIFLTAKVEDTDKIKGLKLGADDYLTKPFNVQELLARIEAVLRRTDVSREARTPPTFTCADISVDFVRHKVTKSGHEVPLTATEYKLLTQLVANAGRVMLHRELLTRVWGSEYQDELDYLRAYVRHLRAKIEDDPHHPRYIQAKPGIGYIFVTPE
ncbi:MAG: response regulator transcription factor [Chloroflexota bacterium]